MTRALALWAGDNGAAAAVTVLSGRMDGAIGAADNQHTDSLAYDQAAAAGQVDTEGRLSTFSQAFRQMYVRGPSSEK